MVLFRTKFIYILTISYHVFRWESCKGSVWESVKKYSSLCKVAGTCDWILWVAHGLQAARNCTRAKHAKKLKRHASWSTTGQKVHTSLSVSSRLELRAQSSHKAKSPASSVLKNWLFAFQTHTSINTPHTHKIMKASRENIERETLEKNKIDLSTSFTKRLFKFLYSHPLHYYILERFITKTFSHHTHICEKAIWCFGKQLGRDQFTLVDAMVYSGIR